MGVHHLFFLMMRGWLMGPSPTRVPSEESFRLESLHGIRQDKSTPLNHSVKHPVQPYLPKCADSSTERQVPPARQRRSVHPSSRSSVHLDCLAVANGNRGIKLNLEQATQWFHYTRPRQLQSRSRLEWPYRSSHLLAHLTLSFSVLLWCYSLCRIVR